MHSRCRGEFLLSSFIGNVMNSTIVDLRFPFRTSMLTNIESSCQIFERENLPRMESADV